MTHLIIKNEQAVDRPVEVIKSIKMKNQYLFWYSAMNAKY